MTDRPKRPTTEELRELWAAQNWDALVPILSEIARYRAMECFRRTSDDVDATDDIVQVTLMKCWRYTKVPDDPRAFAGRVARNAALDVRKHKHAASRDSYADLDGLHDPDSLTLQIDDLIHEEETRAVRKALDQLPQRHREVLILRVYKKMSVLQIAAHYGLDAGVVRMRLFRARAALAKAYENLTLDL